MMTRDDIIRKFLDLHPDTPIDGQEYAIPLRIISRMLEVAAAAEREAIASILDEYDHKVAPSLMAKAIRARGQK